MSNGDRVWIIEDGVVGTVIKYGATMSLVSWNDNGVIHEEYLDNSEFLDYEIIEE